MLDATHLDRQRRLHAIYTERDVDSSGRTSCACIGVSSAGETNSRVRASGRAYQVLATSPTSGHSLASHGDGSTMAAVRRHGISPSGRMPTMAASWSPRRRLH